MIIIQVVLFHTFFNTDVEEKANYENSKYGSNENMNVIFTSIMKKDFSQVKSRIFSRILGSYFFPCLEFSSLVKYAKYAEKYTLNFGTSENFLCSSSH